MSRTAAITIVSGRRVFTLAAVMWPNLFRVLPFAEIMFLDTTGIKFGIGIGNVEIYLSYVRMLTLEELMGDVLLRKEHERAEATDSDGEL